MDPEDYEFDPPSGVQECVLCGGWFQPECDPDDHCTICAVAESEPVSPNAPPPMSRKP